MDHLCYLCLVFVMLSRLLIAALWPPAGKGLTSWLSFVMFNSVFVTFPCGILGRVSYLIVSIPDLCHLSYFDVHHSPLIMDIICFRSLISTSFDGFSQDRCQQIMKASLNYY